MRFFQLLLLFAAPQVVKERLLDLLSREEEEESRAEDVVRPVTSDPRGSHERRTFLQVKALFLFLPKELNSRWDFSKIRLVLRCDARVSDSLGPFQPVGLIVAH